MTLRFTILGCGFSGGVPRPGFGWGACNPNNPKNRRRRCSILVEREGPDGARTRVLVDTSPDLREQLLDAGVNDLDAVLFTHEHADHLHGIDDLRSLVIRHKRRGLLFLVAKLRMLVDLSAPLNHLLLDGCGPLAYDRFDRRRIRPGGRSRCVLRSLLGHRGGRENEHHHEDDQA